MSDNFSADIGRMIAQALNENEPPFALARRVRARTAGREVDWATVTEVATSEITDGAAKELGDFMAFKLERTGKLRFLSNTYDPTRKDAKMLHCYSFHAWGDPQAADFEWQQHLRWISEHRVGDPKGTDAYSVEELKAMGMIGVYAEEKDEAQSDTENGVPA